MTHPRTGNYTSKQIQNILSKVLNPSSNENLRTGRKITAEELLKRW